MERFYWKTNPLLRGPRLRASRPAQNANLALILTLIITLLLSACGEQVARQGEPYFIPPTLVEKAAPVTLETAIPSPQPSPTAVCENGMTFLEDLTVPDGTAFAPGATIDKVWKVQNAGSCNWDAAYRIKLSSGTALGAEPEQALFPARGGSEVEVRIIFTAPQEAGSYSTAWQAYDPQGREFGDPIFMLIEVDPSLEITPNATPTGESVR